MALATDNILLDVFGEVTLRDPTFFTRQPVGFEPISTLVERYRSHPLFAAVGDAAIERQLAAAQAFFAARGLQRAEQPAAQSRLAHVLCDAAMDAMAADTGLIPLRAPARRSEAFAEVLASDYDMRATPGGVTYLVRKGGRRWLLIVGAVGIPVAAWSRLLGDTDHDYKVLVVESAGCDLIAGGQSGEADLISDTARIARVLDAEGVEAIDVVGWCSGGRIAVQLAADEPERVQSLILISASLRGVAGSDVKATQFEEDINGIFDAVTRSPGTAGFLSDLLMNSNKLAQPPVEDAALFRLPAREQAAALVAPLATGEDLKRYAARIAADKAHATAVSLAAVLAPILAIAGRHDHVISNAHTWETLKACAPQTVNAVISGAGHYGYDLQYPYFLMLLDAFTQGRPFAAARIGALDAPA